MGIKKLYMVAGHYIEGLFDCYFKRFHKLSYWFIYWLLYLNFYWFLYCWIYFEWLFDCWIIFIVWLLY